MGKLDELKDYQWEYHLVQSDEVNAWCMPGGKIVVYTGILPLTENADALAVVLGHEVSHALLNHGQQQSSASLIQQAGLLGLQAVTSNSANADLYAQAYVLATTVAGTLPFSRGQESQADQYGLTLMAIAGYDPNEAVPFWQRMAALTADSSASTPEFLSTHPSDENRIADIKKWIPDATAKAAELNKN
jgi:predicted Zn-dependent protease